MVKPRVDNGDMEGKKYFIGREINEVVVPWESTGYKRAKAHER